MPGSDRGPTSRSAMLLIAPIVFAVSGCGSEKASGDQVVAVPTGTPMEIGAQPAVEVGSAEGDSSQVLHRVLNPLFVDGRLVIPMAEGRVQVHEKTGRLADVLGGRGQGPGEFEWLTAVWMRGDTLEAHDATQQRITRFAPDGSVQVVQLEAVVSMPSVRGPVNDGWILTSVANPRGSSAQRSRDTLVLRHHGLDGIHTGEIHRIAGLARYLDSSGRAVPEPLSPTARVRTHAGEIYIGETLEPSIKVLDSNGNLLREFSWSAEAPRSPHEAFEAVKEQVLARAEADRMPEVRTRLRAAPAPVRLSIWWDFLIDELGFLWVRPYDLSRHAHELGGWRGAGAGGEWLVFDPDRRLVATIEAPAHLELSHVTADAVIGISRDEFGVESVMVHSLRRSGGPE